MKVTTLYFDTISKIIKEHGYLWENVEAIQDNDSRYKYGENNECSSSLEYAFYISHMYRGCELEETCFLKDWKLPDNLLSAFLHSLAETNA